MGDQVQTMNVEDLRILAERALIGLGLTAEDAEKTASILVLADLFGISTHGVSRIVSYGERLMIGGINATPNIGIEAVAPSILMVDGDNGVGPLVGRRALDRAAALLAEGRAAEALTQLKAAEALARLDAAEALATPEPSEAEYEVVRVKAGQIIEVRATELAHEMLAEGVRPGVRWGGYALRWRAATYGSEAAEADRRAAEAEGWADRYWDAEGRLKPREAGDMEWG